MLELANAVETPIRQRVAAAERIVVKVGTNVIMRDDGAPAVGLVYGLVEAAVNVKRAGKQILLVSSGAIGLGAKCLKLERPPTELALKQACAAIGQSRLMSLYQDAFSHFDIATAQILLTEDDFLDPVRYSNLLATLRTLLELGVVPIINENDTVSTLELDRPGHGEPQGAEARVSGDRVLGDRVSGDRVFGDNDKLSALVMTKIDAHLLILLSDVEGLYTGHPRDREASFVPEVEAITPALLAYAKASTGRGRGGMLSKIEAARLVVDAGRIAVIANGRTPGIVERVCSGDDVGTVFYPAGESLVVRDIPATGKRSGKRL
ncbi:MAG TPA: glutamate 5-kinase [Acidisarcina sp.]